MAAERETRGVVGTGLRPVQVIKFGGTSVTGGDRIDTIARVAHERLGVASPVLVVSAFAKVTTLLERAAVAARHGERSSAFQEVLDVHDRAVRAMTASSASVRPHTEALLRDGSALLARIAAERACSPATLDEVLSFGERLSSSIVTAGLVERGVDAVRVDAADVIVTDANHGDARADLEATRSRLGALPARPAVPVVTGFLGATSDGVRTTLGREGSDYSAAILAWGLDAERVEIWTDVDGVMTADPRVVPDARPLRSLSYEELFELSSWGAKVVHPKTIRPLQERSIGLSIRNTTSPSDPGTRVRSAGSRDRAGPLGVARLDVEALRSPGRGEPSDERTRAELAELLDVLSGVDARTAVVTLVRGARADGSPGRGPLTDVLRGEGIAVLDSSESSSGALSFGVHAQDADAAVRTIHQAAFASISSDALHA